MLQAGAEYLGKHNLHYHVYFVPVDIELPDVIKIAYGGPPIRALLESIYKTNIFSNLTNPSNNLQYCSQMKASD